MNYLILLVSVVSTLFWSNVYSTTWGESEVDDPIIKGKKCAVHEPASYGSYIYSWPSKYDQTFWPHTDDQGIWYCSESGFIAFIGDFEEISESEIIKINAYLKGKAVDVSKVEEKLKHLENIYSLREKDKHFNNHLVRTLAYLYERNNNQLIANRYRARALEEIETDLLTDSNEYQKLTYLYVAANYSRQLGNYEKSDSYLENLISAISSIQDKELEGFGEYLTELLSHTPYIEKGGNLMPTVPDKDA